MTPLISTVRMLVFPDLNVASVVISTVLVIRLAVAVTVDGSWAPGTKVGPAETLTAVTVPALVLIVWKPPWALAAICKELSAPFQTRNSSTLAVIFGSGQLSQPIQLFKSCTPGVIVLVTPVIFPT